MEPQELVKQYLSQKHVMQLAAATDNKPYLCTVHYYSDDGLNLYWCSTTEARHSRAIDENPQVAAYVLIHENTPEENYVIGITLLGKAELIGDKIDRQVLSAYAEKLGKTDKFVREVIDDTTSYKFYRLRPNQIILFDNKDFPDDPRREIGVN